MQNLVRGNCALLPCCSIQLGVYHSFPLSSAFYRFKCQSFVCHALSRVFLVLDSVNTTFDVDAIGSAITFNSRKSNLYKGIDKFKDDMVISRPTTQRCNSVRIKYLISCFLPRSMRCLKFKYCCFPQ